MQESGENYLKAVFLLQQKHPQVHLTEVARYLNVTKASTSRAMKVLEKDGYIIHQSYKAIELTDKGRSAAADIIERFDYLTTFLHEVLQVDYEVAVKDACRIEHDISEQTLGKLIEYLHRCRTLDT
ncbi:MAG: metal-dependent transcriptional regulator [Sphaerochaetaceae bacterium]|nr:metal-dependent transcriptional regulator [Sphaerochaetaceae bacterium]